MSRIAFVVQRYGLEVNGGAELHCRMLAEQMRTKYEQVDVITTCALDHLSWQDHYPAGETYINGIRVLRFPVEKERNLREFSSINRIFLKGRLPEEREEEWIRKQGPYCPQMIEYIREHADDYCCLIFFTYLYYPTVIGLPKVAGKSILLPTAHNEPFLYMGIMKKVFQSPKVLFFSTEEERQLVHRVFRNGDIPFAIGGVGIEIPDDVSEERFRKKYGSAPFLLYVGRIEEGKNVKELFRYFIRYKRKYRSDLRLLLMGKKMMHIPRRKDIQFLGFVSDEDKFDGMAAANAVVMPSQFESLSMVALEAMALERSLLVNGKCDVLKGHCIRSKGALYYTDYAMFEKAIMMFMKDGEECREMNKKAKEYVNSNYKWDIIVDKLDRLIRDNFVVKG